MERAEQSPLASVRDVYVAHFRHQTGQAENFGEPRPRSVGFQRFDVSIPPGHQVGQIEWAEGTPDATRHFVTTGEEAYPNIRSFAQAVASSDQSGVRETVIHVHGYNTTHAEAVYGAAQVAHDLNVPVPMVLFSWPSAAETRGYIYDRDSALISRDVLEELIIAFAEYPDRKLFLTAHSMGSYLLMETLRQIAISGRLDIGRDLNGVLLLAPDIDVELFQEQVDRIGKLPEPFLILVSEKDRALGLSSFLSGNEGRLGTLTSAADVEGLGVTLIDVSALSNGKGLNHSIATTSPAAIAVFRKLNEVTSPGDIHVTESIIKADNSPTLFESLRGGY